VGSPQSSLFGFCFAVPGGGAEKVFEENYVRGENISVQIVQIVKSWNLYGSGRLDFILPFIVCCRSLSTANRVYPVAFVNKNHKISDTNSLLQMAKLVLNGGQCYHRKDALRQFTIILPTTTIIIHSAAMLACLLSIILFDTLHRIANTKSSISKVRIFKFGDFSRT